MTRQAEIERLSSYDFEGRNEAEIRGDWIEPLLRLLGYGLGTRHRVVREQSLALHPPVRMVGSSRIEIDFVPTVFGERLWVIEAKRPRRHGDLFGQRHLGQAWSYATDPRIAVPLMVLCDGTRLGIFDVTQPNWDEPVFDHSKDELTRHFDELLGWLGARQVADRVRRTQLAHLRTALLAQVDLSALDRTISDVKALVDEARPVVHQRRAQIRDEARERVRSRGAEARDKAGIWGHAQHLNGPRFTPMADVDHAASLILRQAPIVREREFKDFERATTPRGQSRPRMWFWLRVVRMGTAVLLSDSDGCADHCRREAIRAAHDHATGFAGDPIEAAAYRLQRFLGPLGTRLAAQAMPDLVALETKTVETLDAEEWLRRDGELGVTADAAYMRMADLTPIRLLVAVDPWDVPTLTKTADAVEALLPELPKPASLVHLQPAGDEWLDSWLTGDPLRTVSEWTLRRLASREESDTAQLAASLISDYYDVSEVEQEPDLDH
jgi:hypothetical protein